jgi:hypothetical protein
MSKKEINLEEIVYNTKTKNKHGYTDREIFYLILKIGGTINLDRYNDAMMGNTCMMDGDDIINYHCDVVTALSCGFENRDIKLNEFD